MKEQRVTWFIDTRQWIQPLRILLLFLLLLTASTKGRADDGQADNKSADRPKVRITSSLQQVDQADIDDTASSIGYSKVTAGIEWQFLVLDLDYRTYDWNSTAILGVVEPWEDLTRLAPGVQYYRELDDNWALWLKGVVIAGFEDGLSTDALTYNPQGLGLYSLTRQLSLYCGLGMLYHPVDTSIYPIVGVSWNRDAKQGVSGSLGFPEAKLRYGFNDKTALKVDLQWDSRIYSLAEENQLAPEGYVQEKDISSGLYLEYSPVTQLLLNVGIRRYYGRELTIFSHGEDEILAKDVDGAWSYLLGAEYNF